MSMLSTEIRSTVFDWLWAGGMNSLGEIQGYFDLWNDGQMLLELAVTVPWLLDDPEAGLEAVRYWRAWFSQSRGVPGGHGAGIVK